MPASKTDPAKKAVDWDSWSESAKADPYAVQAELCRRCPFPYSERLGGFTSITRYADIVAAVHDTGHFKNGLSPELARPMPPLETDPPEHTAYRWLLQPFFNVPRMRTIEHRLRAFTVELLDSLLPRGRADFAGAFTFILPVRAVCFLLNLPDSDWPQIKEWSRSRSCCHARNAFLWTVKSCAPSFIAEPMSRDLGQPIFIDNRPGAGATIAATFRHRIPACCLIRPAPAAPPGSAAPVPSTWCGSGRSCCR